MSNGNQSYLRFSLEESVWFQKGQEVDELISISLDPIITIQESDQYVTIKGSLDLTGEYNREECNEEDYEEDISSPRSVQTVEVREDGLHLFAHQFPVEVTIPKNRIQDLNDINVTVETFDYAFPEKSCIRLSADLMITGLYGEQQHEFVQEQIEEEEELIEIEPVYRDSSFTNDEWNNSQASFHKPDEEEEETTLDLYTPFEVEARKNPLEENNPQIQQNKTVEEIHTRKEETVGDFVEEIDINEEQGMTFEDDIEMEQQEQEVSFEEGYPEITYGSNQNEAPEEEIAELVDEQEEVSDEHEEADQDGKNKNKWKGKKSLTLSEFFARKTEEDHAKVRMCIVQSGETLEILSERYDIPVSQLQRVNQMELNQDIYEGQVLYIPIYQSQR